MFDRSCQVERGFETENINTGKDVNMGASSATPWMPPSSQRQAAFLQRASTAASEQSWRPRVLHRTAARRWLDNVDNQLRGFAVSDGIKRFVPNDDKKDLWSTS